MREIFLDVRRIPFRHRHERIFTSFAEIGTEETLVLLSDHEPRPLRGEFELTHRDNYSWMQRELGDGHWEIRLSKLIDKSRVGIDVLRRSPIFASLPEATLMELAQVAVRLSMKRHQVIAEQGSMWHYVGVVASGIVQALLSTDGGREQTLFDVLPGDIFGEFALLDAGYMLLRYIASTADTVVMLIPVPSMRRLLDQERGIARAFEVQTAQHSRAILERFSSVLSSSASARVAQVLLRYANPSEGIMESLPPLPTMTQTEIARFAGTVKEVVNRALAEFDEAGAIRRENGHIVGLDRAKLLKASMK